MNIAGYPNFGLRNEGIVEEALTVIKNKRKPDDMPTITNVIHAKPNSNLDRQGIDFLVRFDNGHDVPLQVKSSARAARKFENRCRKNGKFIPVVVVFDRDRIGTIIDRVLKCLKQVFSKISQMINASRCTENKKTERRKSPERRRRFCFRFNTFSMAH